MSELKPRPKTPAANQSANTPGKPGKKITLPSGAKAEMFPFKGKDVRAASRLSDGDEYNGQMALIAISTTIDGKKLLLEDYDEMDGRDVMMLMAEFKGLFS